MTTRKEIRTAVAALCEPHVKTAFPYKPSITDESELPAALVYFEDGETERGHDQDIEDTEGQLVIEIQLKSSDNLDDDLDAIGNLIGADIKNDDSLEGIVDDIERTGFSYARDADSNLGALALYFDVDYPDSD